MYSLSEDSVTQGLHTSLGANFVLLAYYRFHWTLLEACFLTIGYAFLKEFCWDIHAETEETSGGYLGGLRDFSFYMVGMLVTLAIIKL